MLSRFELQIIFRIQVSDRRVRRRYFAVEAAMEELAEELGLDREVAAMTGFGAGLDAQLCASNPARRGEVAAEMLSTEGAPDDVVAAVLAARKEPPDQLAPLAAGLLACDAIVGAAFDELDADPEDSLDDLTARGVAMKLELAARAPTNSEARRARAAAERLGVTLERLAELSLTGMRRVRADLEL